MKFKFYAVFWFSFSWVVCFLTLPSLLGCASYFSFSCCRCHYCHCYLWAFAFLYHRYLEPDRLTGLAATDRKPWKPRVFCGDALVVPSCDASFLEAQCLQMSQALQPPNCRLVFATCTLLTSWRQHRRPFGVSNLLLVSVQVPTSSIPAALRAES